MSTAEKIALLKERIEQVEDEQILDEVLEILNEAAGERDSKPMYELSEEAIQMVKEGDRDIEEGRFSTHEEVMEEMRAMLALERKKKDE